LPVELVQTRQADDRHGPQNWLHSDTGEIYDDEKAWMRDSVNEKEDVELLDTGCIMNVGKN